MKSLVAGTAAAVAALTIAAAASAHAHVTPPVSIAKQSDTYSLIVPTEKEGATTTKIVMTVPKGFSIDSFVPTPGWTRQLQQSGSGEEAVIQKVTWTGGKVPTGEDSFFQFLARPSGTGTYTFHVQQTYSDGSVVDWSGPESSDTPAPTIDVKSSLGGGATPILAIVALVVAALALVVAGVGALAARGGRPLT